MSYESCDNSSLLTISADVFLFMEFGPGALDLQNIAQLNEWIKDDRGVCLPHFLWIATP